MRDEFHKVDDGTTLWSDDEKHYYDNDCHPNVRLVRSGNLLKDKDHNKTYEIVNDKFIYLREDNFRHIEGRPYVWYK
ncbi:MULTISPECIES: hypothetical protein [Lactobacillaceae]|uniref:hypothetical protein n=1 Tax=Lactobacillaceae TaxID=33958 RepID=UPI00128C7CF5|nr:MULTISPECIES: hypothetical protein [Lactobacillaceae]MDM5042663.1 hypothetical protein [Pediococcus acidilactici]MQB66991.1 hypothetical protein [Limosilactobacillus reuteri]